MPYKSDRRLWLAEDGQTVVEDGDPRAATLLVGEGGELSVEDAKRYGLTLKEVKEVAEASVEDRPDDAEPGVQEDGQGLEPAVEFTPDTALVDEVNEGSVVEEKAAAAKTNKARAPRENKAE